MCLVPRRVTEKSNSFFCLQKRRGHGDGRGIAAMVIGTIDNIRDSRPPPYRILLQTVSVLVSPSFSVMSRAITKLVNCTLWELAFTLSARLIRVSCLNSDEDGTGKDTQWNPQIWTLWGPVKCVLCPDFWGECPD